MISFLSLYASYNSPGYFELSSEPTMATLTDRPINPCVGTRARLLMCRITPPGMYAVPKNQAPAHHSVLDAKILTTVIAVSPGHGQLCPCPLVPSCSQSPGRDVPFILMLVTSTSTGLRIPPPFLPRDFFLPPHLLEQC